MATSYSIEQFEKCRHEDYNLRKALLDKFCDKMKWHPSEVALDVGSGPGTITRELLWPILKAKNVVNLIGMDSSEDMVKYAQERHSIEGISFIHGNIEHIDSIPREFEQKFSKAFSFFALQDVASMRKALSNVNWILMPDGEICFMMASFTLMTNAQIQVWNLSPFAELPSEAHFGIGCPNEIFTSPNVEPGFRVLLRQCGFEVSTIKVEHNVKKYEDAESYMEFVTAVDPNYGSLPDKLKAQYKEEMYKHLIESSHCADNDRQMTEVLGEDGAHFYHYKILKIHAVKKTHMKVK